MTSKQVLMYALSVSFLGATIGATIGYFVIVIWLK